MRRLLHSGVVLELLTGVAFRCMLLTDLIPACYSGIGFLGMDFRSVWDQRLLLASFAFNCFQLESEHCFID